MEPPLTYRNRHILAIPELIGMICCLLDKQSRVSLLTVSRNTYAAVLPFTWEDVDLKPLLNLIPGMTIIQGAPTSLEPKYSFEFPTHIDMARFNAFSPFIKILRTSGPYAIDFPNEWPCSGSRPTAKPLFPNLKHLVINTCGPAQPSELHWISALLYPGLLGFEMFSVGCEPDGLYYPWLDLDASFDLIGRISHTCPRVDTLRIFPEEIASYSADNRQNIYKLIANFQHLRSFTFSGTTIHKELLGTLGRLPCLETLSLCSDWGDSTEWHGHEPLEVPDDSFGSLRHLYLYGLEESTISHVCKVPALFRHLVKAAIVFDNPDLAYMSDAERSEIAVRCLGTNSPYLQDLTIYARNPAYFSMSWSTINLLKHMPLKCLTFGKVGFDSEMDEDGNSSDPIDLPDPRWEDFLVSVPHLEELHLEREKLQPQQLWIFASHLPKLRLFVFDSVGLGDVKVLPDRNDSCAATQPIILRTVSYFKPRALRPEAASPDAETISKAARYLSGIWPNVACEVQEATDDYSPDYKTVAELNKCIKALKATNLTFQADTST